MAEINCLNVFDVHFIMYQRNTSLCIQRFILTIEISS